MAAFRAAFFTAIPGNEVTHVKQFLVMKMVEGLNQVAGFMALPGFYTLEAAQNFVSDAHDNEPGAMYMIQEVGAA